jgi:UMF1 family MFS transporter
LAINFGLIALMDDTGLAVRLSLGGSGLWAAVFIALFTHRRLRARPASRPLPANRPGWLRLGFRSVGGTLRDLRRRHPVTLRYLLSYLLFNDGIETVIAISTVFAADELGADATTLLALVLLIQFVAIPGALGFGRLAERLGAKRSLVLSLIVWTGLVVYAYLALTTIAQLWMMGVVLALVLGGSQALARSLYSQMIPDDSEAEYFGFYEIASRGTSWIGPLVFGVVNQLTGSQRQAILSLIIFFVAGIAVLLPIDVRRAMRDAGQDPDRLTVI